VSKTVKEHLLERLKELRIRTEPSFPVETFMARGTLNCGRPDPNRARLYDHLIGKRVRLVHGVDNYPTVRVPAGETGTVLRFVCDSLWVKMDRHFPELAEWDNELQMWDWEDSRYPLVLDFEVLPDPEPERPPIPLEAT
jgi:hypothetical protein